jgi:hypothetical protein
MNDIQQIKSIEIDGWKVVGSAFKKPTSKFMKESNKENWNRVIPWYSWLLITCKCNDKLYWIAQKEV